MIKITYILNIQLLHVPIKIRKTTHTHTRARHCMQPFIIIILKIYGRHLLLAYIAFYDN